MYRSLIIVACFLQILIVLVQNSKGGGLAANFTSTGQTMGVRKTADFLEKATWTLAVAILVLSVAATATIPRSGEEQESRIQEQIQNAVDPMQYQLCQLQFLIRILSTDGGRIGYNRRYLECQFVIRLTFFLSKMIKLLPNSCTIFTFGINSVK